jgi:hypothetical protein
MLALLIAILIVIGNQHKIFGETTTWISAYDESNSILIANQDDLNIILFQNENGLSEHYDSTIKKYKSGGFSMKSPESGILVYGHKISMSEYKLVIITSEKVYRLIGFVDVLEEIQTQTTIIEESIIIEPKSSIGADVSKWIIPTHNSKNQEPSMLLTIKGEKIDSLQLGDSYEKTFRVYDARSNSNLENADVSLEISRDEFIYKTGNEKSSLAGMVDFEIKDLSYPLFYPNFCYDVKITATFGNETTTWNDEFMMYHSGVWNPSFDWLSESRWNYLPSDFADEPRESTYADEHCN